MVQDAYHQEVKRALVKDGWTITDDPFYILYKGTRAYADLAAEKPMAAQKGERKIVVEIKVFGTPSPMTELERAVGQYGIYRTFLKRLSPERELFLAIALDIWQDFFLKSAVQDIVADHQISILVFSPEIEEVVQWIN
ncbi:MAG: XisH family protein [Acidobacteria bacterium]|nr:XisH family protein [Acidobacteriota bacterium]